MTPRLDYPPSECSLCGRSIWWRSRRPGSAWICATCLPPLLEPAEVEWIDEVPVWEARP